MFDIYVFIVLPLNQAYVGTVGTGSAVDISLFPPALLLIGLILFYDTLTVSYSTSPLSQFISPANLLRHQIPYTPPKVTSNPASTLPRVRIHERKIIDRALSRLRRGVSTQVIWR